MSYSIFMRQLQGEIGQDVEMIAYGIETSASAQSLLHGLASSYNEHGHEAATDVYWFRSLAGLHEIWAWPTLQAAV